MMLVTMLITLFKGNTWHQLKIWWPLVSCWWQGWETWFSCFALTWYENECEGRIHNISSTGALHLQCTVVYSLYFILLIILLDMTYSIKVIQRYEDRIWLHRVKSVFMVLYQLVTQCQRGQQDGYNIIIQQIKTI